ncbi:MAG: hypothetical protein HYY18_19190 [Planctomycetes bacterium]|nr:hypothetical protein [Planctomycetota bacterium]
MDYLYPRLAAAAQGMGLAGFGVRGSAFGVLAGAQPSTLILFYRLSKSFVSPFIAFHPERNCA